MVVESIGEEELSLFAECGEGGQPCSVYVEGWGGNIKNIKNKYYKAILNCKVRCCCCCCVRYVVSRSAAPSASPAAFYIPRHRLVCGMALTFILSSCLANHKQAQVFWRCAGPHVVQHSSTLWVITAYITPLGRAPATDGGAGGPSLSSTTKASASTVVAVGGRRAAVCSKARASSRMRW
eukprot:scaffold2150_cov137-Isochrysis_galbana.AAC.1